MKQKTKENLFNIIIMIIYACISFILIFYHENWRDEAQAWMLARDLNIFELISQLKYEGHFILWFLILMPFAKLGFPYITTNIISWLICLLSVILILWKSPLKKYQKILFVFSAPMIYLYPVISRPYCLIPLAISLIACFYKDRKENPIRYILSIALLANTHAIMYGMVGVLLLEFFIECFKERKNNSTEQNKKYIISFILVVVLILLTILPILTSLFENKIITYNTNTNSLSNLLIMIISYIIITIFLIIKLFVKKYNSVFFSILNDIFSLIGTIIIAYYIDILIQNIYIIAIIIPIIFLCFNNYPKYSLQFVTILFWQFFVNIFICSANAQRIHSIILTIMFFMWIYHYEKEEFRNTNHWQNFIIKILFIIFMIIDILYYGIYNIYYEINYNYSSGYQMADYISENIDEGSIFVTAGSPAYISSIIPYLSEDYKFYYIQSNSYFTFVTWDETYNIIIDEDYGIEELKEIFGNQDNVYYIVNWHNDNFLNDTYIMENLEAGNYLEELFSTDSSMTNENYTIYKIDLSE